MAIRGDGDASAELEITQRLYWRAQLDAAETPAERANVRQAGMKALGLNRSRFYEVMKQIRETGREGARRATRSDLGGTHGHDDIREAWVAYRRLHLHRPLAVVRREFLRIWLAANPEAEAPSENTFRRWASDLDQGFAQTPAERQRDRRRTVSVVAAYPNHVWQMDQHQADFFVRQDIVDTTTGEITERRFRPLLFTLLDEASGCVMASHYYEGSHTAYSTEIVTSTFLMAVYPDPELDPLSGVPEYLYTDRGAAHKSNWFLRVCDLFGVKLVYSKPRQPQSHGLIEGWHNILCQQFESGLPGYCGPNNRQEARPLERRLESERIGGTAPLLTLDQANAKFRAWLPQLHRQPYQSQGSTLSRWARWSGYVQSERHDAAGRPVLCGTRAYPPREDIAWKTMDCRDQVSVRGGQFQLRNVVYTAPDLGAYNGLKLSAYYLPGHVQHVWVASGDRLVAVARPLESHVFAADAGFADVGAATREQREEDAGLRASAALLNRKLPYIEDPEEAARVQQAAELLTTQKSLRPQQAAALKRRLHPDRGVIDLASRRKPVERSLPQVERPTPTDLDELLSVPEPATPAADAYDHI